VYLALGDSITFGIGVPRPQENGYVARVADALSGADAEPLVAFTRVFAVPGETAAGFLEQRLDDVERAIEELGPRVELVTIGLGANEILRARRHPACVPDRASEGCRAVVAEAAATAASALDAVVAGVRSALEAAGSDASVLLLAYYNPDPDALAVASVAGSDGAVGCDPMEERPGLNDRIACVAAARSAGLVDLHAAFLGRENELTRFRAGDVHPNAAGYEVIADTILDALPFGGG
jgi:lysophospholipase L1-like esterase